MNKLEKCAIAICRADGQDWDILTASYNGRERQRDYKRYVNACLEELIDMTPDTYLAGVNAHCIAGRPAVQDTCRITLPAIINHILNGGD